VGDRFATEMQLAGAVGARRPPLMRSEPPRRDVRTVLCRRGVRALVGGLGRIGGLMGVGEAGGTGGTEGEADAFGGREGLAHRFAAAWVRVRAAFGDG